MGTYEFPELLDGIVSNKKFPIFTTRPDTIFGATYLVLAPEHELLIKLKPQITNWADVEKYIAKTSDGKEVTVFEIAVGEDVMEIDAVGEKAQAILESFQFSGMSDAFASSVSHWDVREKRFCAPMVTYAREPGGISCTAYMNPCDIPDAFEVCDAEDAE